MKSTFYYSQDIKEEEKPASTFNTTMFIFVTIGIILLSIIGYIQFKDNKFFHINNFMKFNPIVTKKSTWSDEELQAISSIIVKEIEKSEFKKNKFLVQESEKQKKEIVILLNALTDELKN
jgi:hypothetical protein